MNSTLDSENQSSWIFFLQPETQISLLETNSYNLAKVLYGEDGGRTGYIVAAAFDIYRVNGDTNFVEELIKYSRAWQTITEPLDKQIAQMLIVATTHDGVAEQEIANFIKICRKYKLVIQLEKVDLNKKPILFRAPPLELLLL